MDVCICMAESLSCPPETITTLLISYTPIQNKTFLKKNFNREPLKGFGLKRILTSGILKGPLTLVDRMVEEK